MRGTVQWRHSLHSPTKNPSSAMIGRKSPGLDGGMGGCQDRDLLLGKSGSQPTPRTGVPHRTRESCTVGRGRWLSCRNGVSVDTYRPRRIKVLGEDLENGRNRIYALRRNSDARTRSRNCFCTSGGEAGGGALAGCDFATAGAALFAAFFGAVSAARRARCLVAKSFALASTLPAGEPSRAMRWCWQSTAWQYTAPFSSG